jgi:hypothetical protein
MFLPEIDALYREKDKEEYAEGVLELHMTLAAKSLSDLAQAKLYQHKVPGSLQDHNKNFIESVKVLDNSRRILEFNLLIKGLYDVLELKSKPNN